MKNVTQVEAVSGEDFMAVSRRQLFWFMALSGGYSAAADAAEPAATLDVLRSVSVAHGSGLSDARLRVIQPVLEHRWPQLRALREFEVKDAVEPSHGVR